MPAADKAIEMKTNPRYVPCTLVVLIEPFSFGIYKKSMYNLKVRSRFQILLLEFGLISQICLLVQNYILVLIFVRIMRKQGNWGKGVIQDSFFSGAIIKNI